MKITIAMLALTCASTLSAQQLPDSGSFFVRLGSDTVAVERYTRTRHQLVSEALLRTPITRRIKLTVTFKDDGTISWWEVLNSPVAGTPNSGPVTRGLVTLVGDSAQVQYWSAGAPRSSGKIPAHPRLMPLQVPFYSTYDVALQNARKQPRDTALSVMAGNSPLTYRVEYLRADSVRLSHPQSGIIVAKLDEHGRLTRLNAEGTTLKVIVTRSKPVDLQQWATRFAKADAEGKSIGLLSPRDTVQAVVGGAWVAVDYSRPSKRSRVIFGGIVPWDQVWRTGANAATTLTVDVKPIQIGTTRLPPGKYSLWTIPSKSGWKLIINKQSGQWGTNYDPAQDIARIDVKTEAVAVPVETFQIALFQSTAAPNEGRMTLTWDRTRVVVPFGVVN